MQQQQQHMQPFQPGLVTQPLPYQAQQQQAYYSHPNNNNNNNSNNNSNTNQPGLEMGMSMGLAMASGQPVQQPYAYNPGVPAAMPINSMHNMQGYPSFAEQPGQGQAQAQEQGQEAAAPVAFGTYNYGAPPLNANGQALESQPQQQYYVPQ